MLNSVLIEGYAVDVRRDKDYDNLNRFKLMFEQTGKLVYVDVSNFTETVPMEGDKVKIRAELHSTLCGEVNKVSLIIHSTSPEEYYLEVIE